MPKFNSLEAFIIIHDSTSNANSKKSYSGTGNHAHAVSMNMVPEANSAVMSKSGAIAIRVVALLAFVGDDLEPRMGHV